ncbi:LacI family DNA-binding transcriptional regulator [Paenibacillus cymbidii]|uniref:LacI family DNA-binding transcriptional regulator n=1 Tax=Paenibacillus cymbidii TaxID=1639034 RepID=UPI001080CEFB|nr:LacI family DNA-binding transcriptional regulator [Paenibacillus cymbidii]
MVTIKDIAARAGVSVTTASLVLNDKDGAVRISAATRKLVLETAAALGYVPNVSARQLRRQGERTLSIALLLPHDSRVSIMGELITGIQRYLLEGDAPAKCSLTVEMYRAGELAEVSGLWEQTRFNGALLANLSERDEAYAHERRFVLPAVLFQRKSDLYPYVDCRNTQAGSDVAAHFIARGHRQLVVLVPRLSSDAINRRLQGMLAALAAAENATEPVIRFGEFSEDGGYRAAAELLQSGFEPTAVVAFSDQMAMGALFALRERGIRVPEACELIGFDDLPFARYTSPPLSTVAIPVQEMAHHAARMLLGRIVPGSPAQASRTFDMPLVHRATTVTAAAGGPNRVL